MRAYMLAAISGAPSWAFANSLADYDFANGRYYRGVFESLSDSRASTAQMDDASNNYSNVPTLTVPLSNKGIRGEEIRVNSTRNNSMQGAVAGSPGTQPTNWFITANGTGGLTRTLSFGTDTTSIEYAGVRFGTSASGGTTYQIEAESGNGAIAAAYGQTWTGSAFVALAAGSLANITNIEIGFDEYNGGTFLASHLSTDFKASLSTVLARKTFSFTPTNPATTSIRGPYVQIVTTGAGETDFTIWDGWPQLENNNINSSVASAVVAAGGAGYLVNDTITLMGGTGTQAVLKVTGVSGTAVTTVSVNSAGSYTTLPPSPAAQGSTSGVGTGATFTLTPTDNAAQGFATSPIRTTSGSATRNADLITEALANLPSILTSGNGFSLYLEVTPLEIVTTSATLAELRLGSNDRLQIYKSATFYRVFDTRASSGVDVSSGVAPVVGTTKKIVVTVLSGSTRISVNGAAVGSTVQSTAIPVYTAAALLSLTVGGSNGNSYLKRFAVLPPLSDFDMVRYST